jgi:tetratricopeptide (TPR) repeat protein
MIHVLLLAFALLQTQGVALPPNPQAAALMQTGVDAEAQGNLDQAIAAFRKAADLAPSDSVAFFRLGEAYMKKHDYAAAISPLKRAAKLAPDSLPVQQMLGFVLLAAGYASQAIPHLETAHEYGALGIAQLQTGKPAEAVANLQAALAKNPDDPDLLFYMSRAATSLSAQSLNRLLSSSPNSARGHQAMGENYFSIKMYPEAEKEYQQALALRPDLPGLRLELGEIYAANSDWQKAETEFREEVKLEPGSAEAAYRLGDALLEEGKMKEAVEELRRSDQLRPDMSDTLYALGKAATLNDPNLAEHALTRVIQLEENTPLAARAYLALAEIHRRQGKTQQAASEMQEYRRIQALTPHFRP